MKCARRTGLLHRTFVALVTLVGAAGIAWPGALWAADTGFFGIPEDAVGTAIVYGYSQLTVSAPPNSASDAEKGILDVVPTNIPTVGPAIGMSFNDWGFLVGFNTFNAEIKKSADVNQTPTDPTDDLYVIGMQGESTTLTLLYSPISNFFLGVGRDRGTLTFQVDPNFVPGGVKKVAFESDYYTIAFSIGFDPTRRKVAPILTLFLRNPLEPGKTGSSVQGLLFGIFF